MTILYSCRTDGDEYRITKWNDGNVESSYLCSESECQCPAGVRPSCRHRDMLPYFINRPAIDTGFWLDWDRGGWVDMRTEDEPTFIEEAGEVPEKVWNNLPQDSSVVKQAAHNGPVAGSTPAPATNGVVTELPATPHESVGMPNGNTASAVAAPAPYRKPRDGRRA